MKKPVPFGKYYLLERINVGGMAEVFRAKSFGVEGFERLVAVKRILPNIAEDRDFIKMFIDEAKIAVQLNHANIAQIFDLGVVDNAYYIALEHIHGRDLRAIFDRCRQNGEPMSIAQACFVVMKVCEGLDYAHNKRDQNNREIGLVHRDVSPQNVLVSFEGEVKLIDFGIAKAADKSAKTQAGILKGKFGYMSPEQVRGLPIDRRSDIFSCGIVLYELLTGERLFVGESDFSTLEKVRNVEILPPSTYNRKIPDELERIVLKALAKDTEDRYLNAIDLHDELQAFVYTASEFYSRKDLAAWMKRTFSKEIEEETAKLESYRQLKAPSDPAARTPAPERRTTSAPPVAPPQSRRPTAAMAVVPPPAPGAGASAPPPLRTSGVQPALGPRSTMAVPAVPPPAKAPFSAPADGRGGPLLAKGAGGASSEDSGLSWDDDELETQIYDNPEEEAAARAAKSAAKRAAGNGAAAGQVAAALAATEAHRDEPDLSSLVSTAKGWDAPAPKGPTMSGPSAPTLLSAPAPILPSFSAPEAGRGANGNNGHGLATGTNKQASPFGDLFGGAAPPAVAPVPMQRESSAVMKLVDASEPIFDAMASFGANVAPPTRKKMSTGMILGIAMAVVFVGVVVALFLTMGSSNNGGGNKTVADQGSASGSGSTAAAKQPTAGSAVASAAGSASASASASGAASDSALPAAGSASASGTAAGTEVAAAAGAPAGFDLYVTPPNVVAWRLDGETKPSTLPARINGLTPGKHTVAIDAPPGFMSESREITLAPGEMQKVEIPLAAIDITGVFSSTPPGAKVTLVTGTQRIDAGVTPTQYKLDPTQRYEVVFEKEGYVSVSKPVQISGQPQEPVDAVLEQAKVAATSIHEKHGGHGKVTDVGPKTTPDGSDGGSKTTDGGSKTTDGGSKTTDGGSKTTDTSGGGDGTLSLGSKPPCDIYIDGKSIGLKTPQREIKLPAGHHKVTLMNNEFGIKESFGVDITAGGVTKQVKDFSDRITGSAPQ